MIPRVRITNHHETQSFGPPINNPDTTNQGRSVCPSIATSVQPQEKFYKQDRSPSSSSPVSLERYIVGIFSRSSSEDYSWLVELLTSEYFRDQILEVRPCYISNSGFQQFMNDLSQCTFGILYHTKNRGRVNITDVNDSLYDEELGYLKSTLERDKVIVLIDDLEDSSDQEKTRIMKNQPSIKELASDLLLISHTEKADKMQLVRKLKSIKQFCHPSDNFSKQGQRPQVVNETLKPTIAVFSISKEGHILWLRKLLSSDIFGHQDVTFHSISLDDKRELRAVEFQCKVAVLYHTMQSGEFPTTPRGESLYHKLLQQMSEKLGRGNVVMIIDDVQAKEMLRVKRIHSDIERLAEDLCPISPKDKEDETKLVQKLKKVQQFRQMSEHPHKVDLSPQTSKTLNTCSQKTPTSRRSIIGIFSVSEEGHIGWLRRLMSSDTFGQREVTYHKMPSYDNVGLEDGKLQCGVAILYHTMKTGQAVTPQGEFLYHKVTDQLVQTLERDKVIVLIDDLEDSSDQEKTQILKNQPSIKELASDLLLISHTEKADKMQLVRKLKSIKQFCHPSDNFSKEGQRPQVLNVKSERTKPTIAVFSMSEECHILWLRRLLSSDMFGQQHHVIFNSISLDDKGGLRDVEFQCKVAVLYHTMQRGEIPDIRHGESLYRKVLQQMSEKLGRENVVMIIDDVQGGKEMLGLKRIPSKIERFTEDVCLILHKDKEDEMKLVQKLKTAQQFRHMSEHPHKVNPAPQTLKTINKTPASRISTIGIFSVSEEGHIDWLRRLMSSDIFGQREVTYHKMPSYDNVGLEEEKIRCGVAILYHTMKTGQIVTSQMEFLYHKATDQLVQKLGKDNVIVLIDDLKGYTDKKWAQWVQSKIEKWAGDLLYFLQEEKHNQMLLVKRLKSLKLFRQSPEYHPNANPVQPAPGTFNTISAPPSAVIGVFSCSEKSKFSWLERLLSSEEFGNHQVIFHQVSSDNMKEFQLMVSLCKFGILYHCMDRGYKPLTDHENSLYDENLKYLSTTLGKSRVIVVMDELGNCDKEAKSWTLENQPNLGMLARDVLLFSKQKNKQQEKPNRSMHVDRNLGMFYENLNTLKEILKEGMTSASFSS